MKPIPNHKRMVRTMSFIGAILFVQAVSAADLLTLYAMAVDKDPAFQAARADWAAEQERKPIARAALLPKVSLNYQNFPINHQVAKQPKGNIEPVRTQRSYTSFSGKLVMTQALYDSGAVARFGQAENQALAADEKWKAKQQELRLKVTTAYVEVLLLTEQYKLAKAQRNALAEQLARNSMALIRGDGTRTDIADTEARLSSADVHLIDAEDNIDIALRALRSLTGADQLETANLHPLRPDFAEKIAPGLQTEALEEWQRIALSSSAELALQRYSIEIARLEIRSQQAGHRPTLELMAQHSRSESESASTYNQGFSSSGIGIALNIPLFSGGGISASARRAAYILQNASSVFDVTKSELFLELKRQYRLSQGGPARIAASLKAVVAAQISLAGNQRAMAVGERVNLDVLNASQQLYTAQRDLAKAEFDLIKARLALRYKAGVLHEADLHETATYFQRGLVDK